MATGTPAGRDGSGDDAAGSLIDIVQALLRELPGLVSDRVELFTLELARASTALGRIVAWLVSISVVGVSAWLALWSGVGIGLVQLGLHWVFALALVLAVNLAAVAVGLNQVRRLARQLSLPATRRHLTLAGGAWGAPTPRPASGSGLGSFNAPHPAAATAATSAAASAAASETPPPLRSAHHAGADASPPVTRW